MGNDTWQAAQDRRLDHQDGQLDGITARLVSICSSLARVETRLDNIETTRANWNRLVLAVIPAIIAGTVTLAGRFL